MKFTTTKWDLVSLAGMDGESPSAVDARNELCRIYWGPIFNYFRRKIENEQDAKDLAQDFFSYFLSRNGFQNADQGKGRLRSYMLRWAELLLRSRFRALASQKRGGGLTAVSFDDDELHEKLASSDTEPGTASARKFDRDWAQSVVNEAHKRLLESDDSERLRVLCKYTIGTQLSKSECDEVARRLNDTPAAVRRALVRLKKEFYTRLLEVIAETARPEEVQDELRYLISLFP